MRFSHFKDTHFRGKYLFEGQMHVLPKQTSCIIDWLIGENDLNLLPEVDFFQLTFRGHQNIRSVHTYLLCPVLPWNSQSLNVYSKPIQFLLKWTVSYSLWVYHIYILWKYPQWLLYPLRSCLLGSWKYLHSSITTFRLKISFGDFSTPGPWKSNSVDWLTLS